MYKQLIGAAIVAAPFLAGPVLAQETTDPNVTVNNNVTVSAAPSAPPVAERVTERTNTTTNTTKIVPVPQEKTTIVRVEDKTVPVMDQTNWGLVAIVAAISIIFLGILLAAMSGGTTTSRRTTIVKS